MANYDDIDRENGEAPVAPETNITEPAPDTAAEPEAPAEAAPAEEAAPAPEPEAPAEAEASAETASAEEPAPAAEAEAAPAPGPAEGQSNPYGSSYGTAPRASMGYTTYAKEKKPAGRARVAVLSSVLVLALLLVSFFGGAAFGRYGMGPLPDLGSQDGTGDGTTDTGSGSTINRGDVVLNVIERDPAEYGEHDLPTVVKKVQNSVVEIRTETAVNSAIYGDYVQSGAGSGVIVSENGLILTCDHVISGAGSITVVLADGSEYTAAVYGEDSWSDLALLKIDAEDLPYAEVPAAALGEGNTYTDYLAVGEDVVAIGNPLGELGGSVSAGIISALGRNVSVEGVPMTLLQTDAAVNPGNSGGGLFNMYGELIGIVNAKSTGDSVEGIGFAIPISDAAGVYRQLYSQGYVSGRPYLGLHFRQLNGALEIIAYDYNYELPRGQAIQNGDMLYAADGTVITTLTELRSVLATKKVGDTMTIQIERYEQNGYNLRQFTIKVHEYVPIW